MVARCWNFAVALCLCFDPRLFLSLHFPTTSSLNTPQNGSNKNNTYICVVVSTEVACDRKSWLGSKVPVIRALIQICLFIERKQPKQYWCFAGRFAAHTQIFIILKLHFSRLRAEGRLVLLVDEFVYILFCMFLNNTRNNPFSGTRLRPLPWTASCLLRFILAGALLCAPPPYQRWHGSQGFPSVLIEGNIIKFFIFFNFYFIFLYFLFFRFISGRIILASFGLFIFFLSFAFLSLIQKK